MINSQLLQAAYYLKKLSLSMRNSFGIEDHITTFIHQLQNIDATFDVLFKNIDIFNPNILDEYAELDPTNMTSNILDKLATIYGVTRHFNLDYVDETTGTPISVTLDLSNKELLLLIKSKILQNNWQGSFEELSRFYADANLPFFIATNSEYGNATMYRIVDPDRPLTENEEHMFKSGLLLVKSMGISYRTLYYNGLMMAKFDNSDENRLFDRGWWS